MTAGIRALVWTRLAFTGLRDTLVATAPMPPRLRVFALIDAAAGSNGGTRCDSTST
jgi:hypothetical protein